MSNLSEFHHTPEELEPGNGPKYAAGALVIALMLGGAGIYLYSTGVVAKPATKTLVAANKPLPPPPMPPVQPAAAQAQTDAAGLTPDGSSAATTLAQNDAVHSTRQGETGHEQQAPKSDTTANPTPTNSNANRASDQKAGAPPADSDASTVPSSGSGQVNGSDTTDQQSDQKSDMGDTTNPAEPAASGQ
jgi:hypothetical protein